MPSIKHLICYVFSGLSIFSCGGDLQIDDSSARSYSGPDITDKNRILEISDIAGVWHFNVPIEGPYGKILATDEIHLVITESGNYIEYDYLGDSFASLQEKQSNCYLKTQYKIGKHPDGGFRIIAAVDSNLTFWWHANFDIENGNLISAGRPNITDCKCKEPIITVPPSTISRTELQSMMCAD